MRLKLASNLREHRIRWNAEFVVARRPSGQPVHFAWVKNEQVPIGQEKLIGCDHRSTLISIRKWMIGDKGVKESCCLIQNRAVYVLPKRRLEWSIHRRFQKSAVPELSRLYRLVESPIRGHHFIMNYLDVFSGKRSAPLILWQACSMRRSISLSKG